MRSLLFLHHFFKNIYNNEVIRLENCTKFADSEKTQASSSYNDIKNGTESDARCLLESDGRQSMHKAKNEAQEQQRKNELR